MNIKKLLGDLNLSGLHQNPLQVEDGRPEVSLSNSDRLLHAGWKVSKVTMIDPGVASVTFNNGINHVATGFSIVDTENPKTMCFAEFLADATGLDAESWLKTLVADLGTAYRGEITLQKTSHPKIFDGS